MGFVKWNNAEENPRLSRFVARHHTSISNVRWSRGKPPHLSSTIQYALTLCVRNVLFCCVINCDEGIILFPSLCRLNSSPCFILVLAFKISNYNTFGFTSLSSNKIIVFGSSFGIAEHAQWTHNHTVDDWWSNSWNRPSFIQISLVENK